MPEQEPKKKTSEVGKCDRCGKLVVFNKFTLCYDCRQDEKAEVEKALDFIKTHRGATLAQVSEATGVNQVMVLKLIRGGRVEAKAKEVVKELKDKEVLPTKRCVPEQLAKQMKDMKKKIDLES